MQRTLILLRFSRADSDSARRRMRPESLTSASGKDENVPRRLACRAVLSERLFERHSELRASALAVLLQEVYPGGHRARVRALGRSRTT